jgi:hypothetical protein
MVKELEGGATYRFTGDQLIRDVAVSGVTEQRPARAEADGVSVKAVLSFSAAGATGTLTARWTTAGSSTDLAAVEARIGGRRVAATLPAP